MIWEGVADHSQWEIGEFGKNSISCASSCECSVDLI